MSEVEILKQFKNALISFLDELITQFPSEADLVIFRIFLKDRIEIDKVLKYFVRKILPLKESVINRDEDFFLNNFSILDSISEDGGDKTKVDHFKRLWRSGQLDDDDKRVVWEWFDSFIFLSEKYQKILLKNNQS